MPKNSRKEENTPGFKKELATQMVTLSTSGFGLVAALAWNNFIQEVFKEYINKFLPGSGSVISMLLYAVIVTVLAVLVTYNLSKIANRVN